MLYKFKVGYSTKAAKSVCCTKHEGVLDHRTISRRIFARVARTSKIRQGHVDLKPWILSNFLEK